MWEEQDKASMEFARPRSVSAAGVAVVAIGAGLWGTDALFRRGLALSAPAASVVFWEHAVLVAVLAVPLWRRRNSLKALNAGDWLALAVIGIGASALATLAFTRALAIDDPTTPLLLQKLQPLLAIGFAAMLLGERPRVRLAGFALPALVGAYLITFADPDEITIDSMVAGALALSAAALWALGTVLGRRLAQKVDAVTLTSVRLTIGLPAALVAVVLSSGVPALPTSNELPAVVGLALVPGLAALVIYYRGLRAAPASLATLAELAFPLSAILVNRFVFGTTLTLTQWFGVVILGGSVTLLSLTARRSAKAAGVDVTARTPVVATTHT